MFNVKSLFARLVLVVSFGGAAGLAGAVPLYHVDINTTSFSGGSGYLALYFQGLGNAAGASATVSQFSGAFVGATELTGDVSGAIPGTVVFGNSGPTNELVQQVALGGVFSFDISFLSANGTAGTTFGVALFDQNGYLGVDGDLANIFVQPGEPITFSAPNAFARVTAVPEPADWLLMATGLGVLVLVSRRRRPTRLA